MMISLHSVMRKVALAVVIMVPSLLLVRATVRPWLADRLSAQSTHESLRRATEYEPGNAERYFAYGKYLELTDQNMEAAAWNFRAATTLNPHRGRYWIELANALNALEDANGEGLALREAVRNDPTNPDIALRAANAFLVHGEASAAVQEFRVVMEHDRSQAPVIFAILWRNTHNADLLIDKALPADPAYAPALLDVLIAQDQATAAAEVWRRWIAQVNEVPAAAGFPYLDYLCKRGAFDAALSAWNELAARSAEIRARQEVNNLLTNGDFEEPILNGGFEWRYTPGALATLGLDSTRFRSGTSSLRIDFTGETGGDAGMAQFVVLAPRQAFTFRGYIRTEAIHSTHGPRFSITDVRSGATLFNSEESIGTTSWTERTATITAAPTARLVSIHVTREPESHITGRAWIDDLSLSPEGRP